MRSLRLGTILASVLISLHAYADCITGTSTTVTNGQTLTPSQCNLSGNGTSLNVNVGGAINATAFGVEIQDATPSSVINNGTITAPYYAIEVSTTGSASANTTLSTLTNTGLISAPDTTFGIGIELDTGTGFFSPSITSLTNSGTVQGATIGIDNSGGGTISTLTNGAGGVIRSTNSSGGIGVNNNSAIGTLSNAGLITGSRYGIYNSASGSGITSLINNVGGTISGTGGVGSFGVYNSGSIGALTNNGAISGEKALVNDAGGTITSLTNNAGGTISTALLSGWAFMNGGTISALTNNGTISASGAASRGIYNSGGTIADLVNTGTIQAGSLGAIKQDSGSTINNLSNSGTIAATNGNAIDNQGIITTLTNTGSIVGGTSYYSIRNSQTIGTLNNAQSNLTYTGALPTNYTIILGNNASTYGKLIATAVTGQMTFGIYGGTVSSSRYTGILQGIAASNVSGSTSGTYSGQAYQLVLETGSTSIWDLLFPGYNPQPVISAQNTLQSVQLNASGLSALYNQQAAAYQAALSYDCQVYDENGMCVSVGGRYTYAGPSPSSNQQAGLVVLGYKPIQTLRVGAFADQSVNVTTPNGFKQNNNSPMWGLFAKWHMNKDEAGLGVQASAVTSASSLNVTRSQLTNTEAGSGTTQFNGQGYQLTTNYHQPVTDSTAVVPYLGLRYTRINAGSYAENASATVTSPLSYNAMAQNTFSAIGGIGVRSHLAEKLTGTASVGIQQNLKYSMGNYAGTSTISGLESFSVGMPGNVNSMATASAGMYYDIRKSERVGVNVLWQQQPFIATNTTTALATYTIGF